MRIISQDGKSDLPYDNLGLFIDDNIIMAEPLNWKRAYVMAEYSSEEKAYEAMRMLHKEHNDYVAMTAKDYGALLNQPKIFRFPEDKDVVL